MFTKITADNIAEMSLNDIVIRYPYGGEPKEKVDITDKNDFTVFKVTHITPFGDVELSFHNLPEAEIALMKVVMGPLNKNQKGIVAENRWWYYRV